MSDDMNKTIAEASLDNLHDVIVPNAVGFFPLAPGWYMVLLLLLGLLFHFAIQAYKYHKKSQYRREALKELTSYSQENKENALALLLLAKRVAIAAYERKEIAKLSDSLWWDFLEKHSKAKVSSHAREDIAKLLYDDAYVMESVLFDEITKFVTLWIKTHKVERNV